MPGGGGASRGGRRCGSTKVGIAEAGFLRGSENDAVEAVGGGAALRSTPPPCGFVEREGGGGEREGERDRELDPEEELRIGENVKSMKTTKYKHDTNVINLLPLRLSFRPPPPPRPTS